MDFSKVIEKAGTSAFRRALLNAFLRRLIPFNRPHGFRITHIEKGGVTVLLPFRRKNLNHIHGMHACALATLCEFTTGLALISRLGMKDYRIILQRLELQYHYQGKTDVTARFAVPEDWMNAHVFSVLKANDRADVVCTVEARDAGDHLVTTGTVYWQIKEWSRVRTPAA